MEVMDKLWMAGQLPTEPPKGMVDWVLDNCAGELGGEYIVFKGERVAIAPTVGEIMEYNDLRPRRHEWAADCTCTACGDSFFTQKVKGHDAIRLLTGEDGQPYTLDPGESYAHYLSDGGTIEEAFEGETFLCPICCSEVKLIHAKHLRGGRTKRIMVQNIQNICGYTAVIYWLVCRTVDEFGISYSGADPADAYVINERGTLVHYTKIRRSSFGTGYSEYYKWYPTSDCKDKLDTPYGDWGSICNRKVGALVYPDVPDLEGMTGEKTGLAEFIGADGYRIVQYLKLWRKYRSIENLCRCGQGQLISDILSRADSYCYATEEEMKKYIDLSEKKPHRMLRISREEFRKLRTENRQLKVDDLDGYNRYRSHGGKLGLLAFLQMAREFTSAGLWAAFELMTQTPGTDLEKIAAYLRKQNISLRQTQLLVDTRRMARLLFPGHPLSQEELWPRELVDAHERLVQIQQEQQEAKNKQAKEEQNRRFAEVAERYADLEWTDGELQVLLPRSNWDLHMEGKILRHCVGGYTNSHLSGEDTIFFVRKYRRPERSYYTLDIRMTNGVPREIQLHGYGNERHGANKEYSHKIPRKVRAFVDKWKRDVLIPWYAEQVRKNIKEESA